MKNNKFVLVMALSFLAWLPIQVWAQETTTEPAKTVTKKVIVYSSSDANISELNLDSLNNMEPAQREAYLKERGFTDVDMESTDGVMTWHAKKPCTEGEVKPCGQEFNYTMRIETDGDDTEHKMVFISTDDDEEVVAPEGEGQVRIIKRKGGEPRMHRVERRIEHGGGFQQAELSGFDAIPAGSEKVFKSRDGKIIVRRDKDGHLSIRFETK